jgi:pimeloyl-ACP methyl ester carboxylesterase
MPIIETERGKFYYADHRQDDTPPLFLIHGAGGTHLDWSIQLRKLGTIVPDLPGHGKSEPPGRTTIDAYADDIIALMNALNLPSAVIGGQSMGGGIALMLALQYPERVRGLVLIGTGAKLRVSPAILDRLLTEQASVGEMFKTMLWGKHTDQRIRDLGYEQFMKTPAEVVHEDYLACNQFDVRDRLSEIRIPALVFGATEDQMTPMKWSEYLAENIAQAQLIRVENAGHMMGLEQPVVVVEAVKRWIEERLR